MRTFRLILMVIFILPVLSRCDNNIDRFSVAISQLNNDLKPEKIEFISGFDASTQKGKSKYLGIDIIQSSIVGKMTEKEKKFNASNYALSIYNCLDSVERNKDMVVRITFSNETSLFYDHQLNHLAIYKQSFKLIDKFLDLYKSQNVDESFNLYSQDLISKHKDSLNTIFNHITRLYDNVERIEMVGFEPITEHSPVEIMVNVGAYSNKISDGRCFLWTFDLIIENNEVKIAGMNI